MFVLGGGGAPFETEELRAGMAKKVFSHMSMADGWLLDDNP